MFVHLQPVGNTGSVLEARLDIARLVPARLGVYRINARNSVGASEENVSVRRRSRTSDSRRDSSSMSGSSRPNYSRTQGNGAAAGKSSRLTPVLID